MSLLIENCTVAAGGRTILSVGRLALPDTKVCALIGPNGAGKSTLLKQFLYHDRSSWRGEAMKAALKRHKAAWVGQHERFRLPMTLSEYVLMGCYPKLAWYRRPPHTDVVRARALLERFDLDHLRNKRIETLSGGEQQRAAVIRALLQEAEILFLDEPTNHLDIRHQHRLMHHLANLPARGTTVVMVLHDLNLAAHYAEHVTLMNGGCIAASGTNAEIMKADLLSRLYGWTILQHTIGGRTWFQAETLQNGQASAPL